MTTSAYFTHPKNLRRLHEGPLGRHLDAFAARLLEEGHCQQSAWRNLRVVGDYSRWLARKGLRLSDVNERTVEQYQRFRQRYRHPFLSDRPALQRFLAVLREVDAIAPPALTPRTEHEQIVDDFKEYLSRERGLRQVTIIRHFPPLRLFLHEHCSLGRSSFSKLTTADISGFVVRHARDQSPRSGRSMCWTLRAFMRYLRYKGYVKGDLSTAVPSVRTWRMQSLPGYLSPKQVNRVLQRIDRDGPCGRRDYAVLLLLARLGLRANEIATLSLDDIDWQTGQLTVRGKGRRRAQMPLPAEVGIAIADYLRHARPTSNNSRRLFLRELAPHIGFSTASNVSVIAKSALIRAGINVPRLGSHLFRHSLATHLLRAGATLTAIGQVLRHQTQDATRIYAKVDISALRTLGLRWPGGVS
jgi:site-specific recombinase XerD